MYIFLIFFFALMSPAYAQDYKNDLLKLSQSIRQTEKQKIEVENRLIELQTDYKKMSVNANKRRYEATQNLHEYRSLNNNAQYKHGYLLQDQSFFERFFHLRNKEVKNDILKHQLNQNIQDLKNIDRKSTDIQHFLNQRETLELNLNVALKQVEVIQTSRKNEKKSILFQSLVTDLKQQNNSLNVFLEKILKIEKIDIIHDKPLVFSIPVSGVVTIDKERLIIKSAPSSLVTTPARGKIIYADNFGNLGLVVIIHHGDGYISILRGLSSSYVNAGFDVIAGEPIGILQGDKNAKNSNQAMLIYELRYNNILTNPLLKMTGL